MCRSLETNIGVFSFLKDSTKTQNKLSVKDSIKIKSAQWADAITQALLIYIAHWRVIIWFILIKLFSNTWHTCRLISFPFGFWINYQSVRSNSNSSMTERGDILFFAAVPTFYMSKGEPSLFFVHPVCLNKPKNADDLLSI